MGAGPPIALSKYMKNLKKFVAAFLAVTLSSQSSFAICREDAPAIQNKSRFDLNLDTYSVYELRSHDLKGGDQFRPTILASVSKLFVTHWALAALPGNHNFRFPMEIFITPTTGGHNVHIAGHNYPKFDASKLDRIFNELSEKGYKKIVQLSFDEKAKFVLDWRMATIGDLPLAYPSKESIAANVNRYNRESKVGNFQTFRIEHSSTYKPAANTSRIVSRSSPLLGILKMMNDESNNHMANRIFQYLGGQKEYEKFIWSAFACGKRRCTPDEVQFYNGSGSPVVEPGPGKEKASLGHYKLRGKEKIYNMAPSVVVVQALAFIHAYMTTPSLNLKLSDVMSITNTGETNHLHRFTEKCYLRGNIVAKTGSVFEAIALAGFLSTKDKGPLAFYFNIDTERKSDWAPAVREIRAYLTGITKLYGEGPNFN